MLVLARAVVLNIPLPKVHLGILLDADSLVPIPESLTQHGMQASGHNPPNRIPGASGAGGQWGWTVHVMLGGRVPGYIWTGLGGMVKLIWGRPHERSGWERRHWVLHQPSSSYLA